MSHKTWLEDHPAADNKISVDIKDMLKEKGKTCISIILPTHRLGSDRQGDRLEIERAVLAAKHAVQYEPKLLVAINDLVEMIDFNHNKEGIGLFVSLNVTKLISFPFPVSKKIVIGKYFHLQDLLYTESYEEDYYVLDISQKEIHLFHGVMDHLDEIRDDHFPQEIKDDYEYSRPDQSSSNSGYAHVKGFEKDKSILQQMRLKKVFHEMDKSLIKYMETKKIPLILCGSPKSIDLYRSVSGHSDNIIAVISDNFRYKGIHDLEVFAWLQLQSHVNTEKLKLIDGFKEKIGEGLGLYGIEETWQAAKEGRGLKLLVEKDYARHAFISENKLNLDPPQESHAIIKDVISDIMNTVLDKKGKVMIVEKDELKDYDRIALITRY